jgi:hypothetical protein
LVYSGVIPLRSFTRILSSKEVQERIECAKSNGSYQSISVPIGAPAMYRCVHEFNDGGKKCFSNDDCEGNCLVTKNTIIAKDKTEVFRAKVVGGFGSCENNDLRYPSYPGDFENPQGYII